MNKNEIDELLQEFEEDIDNDFSLLSPGQRKISNQQLTFNSIGVDQLVVENMNNNVIISNDGFTGPVQLTANKNIEDEVANDLQIFDGTNQIIVGEMDNIDQLLVEEMDNDAIISNDSFIGTDQLIADTSTEDAIAGDLQISDGIVDNVQENKKRSPISWKTNSNKKLRMEGKPYIGYRKTKNKKTYQDVSREAKQIGATCNSKNCQKNSKRMCNIFSENDRLKIFTEFWEKLNWDEKRMYVSLLVKKVPVARRSEAINSRRVYSHFYYLKLDGELVSVCKNMFLNTLSIGECQVQSWCKEDKESGQKKNSQQTQNPFPRTQKTNKKTFVRTFLDKLPKMESHYCKKSTSKLYLEPILQSHLQLYNIYTEKCKEMGESSVSRFLFMDIFNEKNLSLFSPKKDQCDLCCGHQTGNINDEEWKKHIEHKNRSIEEKQVDKEKGLSGEIIVFTMDLQAVKICPLLKASALYYKCKLSVHNFTMYNLASNECMCYWWDETQSDLSASSFTSCIIDQLTKGHNKSPNKNVILWSDGCCYQNKNTVLSNALLEFAVNHTIVIEQKYLTKGHTQMECDSVHSVIEKKLKNVDIHLPSDYLRVTKNARSKPFPYEVKSCDISFFKQYQANFNRYDSIRPGKMTGEPTVTDIKAIRYNYNGTIEYKLDFNHEYSDLDSVQKKRNKKTKTFSPVVYNQLNESSLKIQKTKWDHLQQLKKVLPNDCHSFYDQIKY